MRSSRFFLAFLPIIFLAAFLPLHAECTGEQDHSSNKTSGLLITDFTITGTQTLGSNYPARILSFLWALIFKSLSF
jgi:hypothetical protein